ncbi:MAG: hypothetical protein ACPH3N_01740 [Alcanivorax sediminis]|uniref:Uncharacterized protein n=1 Tax=Alcanivorax sediminis TaxID=2663008 RepID=A0A6N7LSD4_9GAMM|nr:hypothetical protein [Alcanivorax sediminis]MQX53122.1 hypothetical protein [Alcanivorax sediminis]
MKVLSLLSLIGALLILVGYSISPSAEPIAQIQTVPAAKHIVPAMPRSPDILQRVNGAPVHFDAFNTINIEDDDGIEYGVSVHELNLHLVNEKTGNRLI